MVLAAEDFNNYLSVCLSVRLYVCVSAWFLWNRLRCSVTDYKPIPTCRLLSPFILFYVAALCSISVHWLKQ